MNVEKFIYKLEKAIVCFIIISLILIIGKIFFGSRPDRKEKYYNTKEEVEYDKFIDSLLREEKELETFQKQGIKNKKFVVVTITKYNPTKEQCDDDFLVTADNSKIDLKKLESGELRWIAVSRDLRQKFPYGSKVIIHSNDPEIKGVWEVHDTMNERWRNRIDLLRPIGETKGKWNKVMISPIDPEA